MAPQLVDMVIAPLPGPHLASPLATTLGDLALLRHALLPALAGISMTIVLAIIVDVGLNVDPSAPALASRNAVGIGDIAPALESGAARALAFTFAISGAVNGVMLAVALLPPLVTFGLLPGGGLLALALGALSLFLLNLSCLNLAGVMTFLAQSIFPTAWWQKDLASKAMRIAIGRWLTLLAGSSGMPLWLESA
jgi:uncharacterized membrane protein